MDNQFTSLKTMKILCKHNIEGLGMTQPNNVRTKEIKHVRNIGYNVLHQINKKDNY